MITLEKIDQVVERTGVSYQEAKDALESCNANVVEAIIFIEKQKEEEKGSGSMRASDLLETLREFIRRGNVSRVIVSDKENVLLNIPVTIGAVGVILAPVAAVIGVGAVIFTNLNISILDHKGETIDINKVTAERLEFFKKKAEKFKRNAEKAAEEAEKEFEDLAEKVEDSVEDLAENVEDSVKNIFDHSQE